MLWFRAGHNNSLQLFLKPILSFSYLFVFSDIVHKLHLTDSPLSAQTENTHSQLQEELQDKLII